MYNVKLKTGLSPSADDHSISEPQKKRGTYAFKLLKNTEPVYRKYAQYVQAAFWSFPSYLDHYLIGIVYYLWIYILSVLFTYIINFQS